MTCRIDRLSTERGLVLALPPTAEIQRPRIEVQQLQPPSLSSKEIQLPSGNVILGVGSNCDMLEPTPKGENKLA
jgi:hypothetical protein